MLRNIPNKVSQPLLKAIVDETSLGKYDFMYLRIGKAASLQTEVSPLTSFLRLREQLQVRAPPTTSVRSELTVLSSVGYAFINFEDVSICRVPSS